MRIRRVLHHTPAAAPGPVAGAELLPLAWRLASGADEGLNQATRAVLLLLFEPTALAIPGGFR